MVTPRLQGRHVFEGIFIASGKSWIHLSRRVQTVNGDYNSVQEKEFESKMLRNITLEKEGGEFPDLTEILGFLRTPSITTVPKRRGKSSLVMVDEELDSANEDLRRSSASSTRTSRNSGSTSAARSSTGHR